MSNASERGKCSWPVEKWNAALKNADLREVAELRGAILEFESASKKLMECCEKFTTPELQPIMTHVKIQMKNAMSYSKQVFQRLQSIGNDVYQRSKLAQINTARKLYEPKI